MSNITEYRMIHYSKDEIWLYKIGKSYISIFNPKKKKIIVSHYNLLKEIISTVYPEFDKQWGEIRAINPSDIKQYIEKKLRNVR